MLNHGYPGFVIDWEEARLARLTMSTSGWQVREMITRNKTGSGREYGRSGKTANIRSGHLHCDGLDILKKKLSDLLPDAFGPDNP
jgi:hypothetical protein